MTVVLAVLGALSAAAGYGVLIRSRTDRSAAAGVGLWGAAFTAWAVVTALRGVWWAVAVLALAALCCAVTAVRLIVRDYCCPACLDARSSGRGRRG